MQLILIIWLPFRSWRVRASFRGSLLIWYICLYLPTCFHTNSTTSPSLTVSLDFWSQSEYFGHQDIGPSTSPLSGSYSPKFLNSAFHVYHPSLNLASKQTHP
jgi:hypothetical protein